MNYHVNFRLASSWPAGTCPITERDHRNLTPFEKRVLADLEKAKAFMLEKDGSQIENVDGTSDAALGAPLEYDLRHTLPRTRKNKGLKVKFAIEIDEEIISESGGAEWADARNDITDPIRTPVDQTPGGPSVKYSDLTLFQRAVWLGDRAAAGDGFEVRANLDYFWWLASEQKVWKMNKLKEWCDQTYSTKDPHKYLPGQTSRPQYQLELADSHEDEPSDCDNDDHDGRGHIDTTFQGIMDRHRRQVRLREERPVDAKKAEEEGGDIIPKGFGWRVIRGKFPGSGIEFTWETGFY